MPCRPCPRAQVSELGQGSFGVTKLMRHMATGELVAVKFIERGPKVLSLQPSERHAAAQAILSQPRCARNHQSVGHAGRRCTPDDESPCEQSRTTVCIISSRTQQVHTRAPEQ